MKQIDLTNVEEASENKKLVPGGYIAKIIRVDDEADKEYLKISFDIADGEYKGYYSDLFNAFSFWGGTFIKSYKEKALPFFKAFITAVENSNRNYKWDNDEKSLAGKFVGIVLGEEEYWSDKTAEVKTRLIVTSIRSIDSIKKGKFEIPDKKILKDKPSDEFTEVDDDDELPF